MLQHLLIENFALVDRLELELGQGLHVLTGETGAGKSIILDAIDAVLGGRVPGRVIRTGESRALLEASFRPGAGVIAWLQAFEIDPLDDGLVICSREIVSNGTGSRSRSRVNGVLVNRQQMEGLREHLVEITAQGQTVQLCQAARQRGWLDAFGDGALLQLRAEVAEAFSAYQEAKQALEHRRQAEGQRLQLLDMYEFQAKELAAADLDDPDELEQAQLDHQRLGHAVELQQQSFQVYELLYQNDAGGKACADLLGDAEQILREMMRFDPGLQGVVDLVNEAMTQVQEAGNRINSYGDGLETDPETLAELESRIYELKQICRKYGPTLGDAIAYFEKISAELAAFSDESQSLEALAATLEATEAKLLQRCTRLTQLRRKTAETLESQLLAELKPLAMEKVQFQVQISPVLPTAHGADGICFLFSPNPGEPLQPLSETASGGEMSRFLLALKACFSQVDPVGTLVFDEIDTGVSGRVSQAIADKLSQLGENQQVLCVTHQPLIAAQADHHYRVNKEVLPEGRTVVRVMGLGDRDARRQELAELAGGKSAQEAVAFAESLLSQAEAQKQGQLSPGAQVPVPQPGKAVAAKAAVKTTVKPATKPATKTSAQVDPENRAAPRSRKQRVPAS